MQSSPKQSTRKKFLVLTAAAFCSATILRLLTRKKKTQELYTVKMLAQDGTLVEVERKWIERPGKKISTRELQQWVTHNTEKNKH